MSRIEKGNQRFRPIIASRRGAAAEAPAPAPSPGAVQPPARSAAAESARVALPKGTHAQATPPSWAPSGPPPVASARSYAFSSPSRAGVGMAVRASAPKSIHVPQRPHPVPAREGSGAPAVARSEGAAPVRSVAPPASDEADGSAPFAAFMQAGVSGAARQPVTQADVSALWHRLGDAERVAHERGTAPPGAEMPWAAEATGDVSDAAATADGARTRRSQRSAGKRRLATTISDDEAEYKAQCARLEPGAMDAQTAGAADAPPLPLRVDVGATRMESISVTHWKSGRASSRTFELERVRARQLKRRRQESRAGDDQTADPADELKSSGTPAPGVLDTPAAEEVETRAPDAEPNASETPVALPPPAGGEPASGGEPVPGGEPAFGENRFAVQTRIVDGRIVLDEQSLYANYRDEEQQAREQRNWEVVDEREGDQFVNSASRSKQRRTQRWSAEETEHFFHAVSQWGTDFEMITRLFPRRTRREIKSKWTKESKHNAQRLDAAFNRRVAVDLTAYGQAAGVDLSGPPPTIVPKADPKASQAHEG
ncbi:hypothetical protein MSPP1_002326 [Malassezia sp. CBS 17886]|nr:hypothetical protein MSPP1_002326 [Malassezia sp. CBS 17886]